MCGVLLTRAQDIIHSERFAYKCKIVTPPVTGGGKNLGRRSPGEGKFRTTGHRGRSQEQGRGLNGTNYCDSNALKTLGTLVAGVGADDSSLGVLLGVGRILR